MGYLTLHLNLTLNITSQTSKPKPNSKTDKATRKAGMNTDLQIQQHTRLHENTNGEQLQNCEGGVSKRLYKEGAAKGSQLKLRVGGDKGMLGTVLLYMIGTEEWDRLSRR